ALFNTNITVRIKYLSTGNMVQRLAAHKAVKQGGGGFFALKLRQVVGIVDHSKGGVGALAGHGGVFSGQGKVVVFAGGDQGRALRVGGKAGEIQQTLGILRIALPLVVAQTGNLPVQQTAVSGADFGFLQAAVVDQVAHRGGG